MIGNCGQVYRGDSVYRKFQTLAYFGHVTVVNDVTVCERLDRVANVFEKNKESLFNHINFQHINYIVNHYKNRMFYCLPLFPSFYKKMFAFFLQKNDNVVKILV